MFPKILSSLAQMNVLKTARGNRHRGPDKVCRSVSRHGDNKIRWASRFLSRDLQPAAPELQATLWTSHDGS